MGLLLVWLLLNGWILLLFHVTMEFHPGSTNPAIVWHNIASPKPVWYPIPYILVVWGTKVLLGILKPSRQPGYLPQKYFFHLHLQLLVQMLMGSYNCIVPCQVTGIHMKQQFHEWIHLDCHTLDHKKVSLAHGFGTLLTHRKGCEGDFYAVFSWFSSWSYVPTQVKTVAVKTMPWCTTPNPFAGLLVCDKPVLCTKCDQSLSRSSSRDNIDFSFTNPILEHWTRTCSIIL